MEDQSPFVTSSSSFGNDSDQHRGAEEAKPRVQPWDDMDDVLDLTEGAGQMAHPTFSVSFPGKPAAAEDEEERKSYSDSLEPSPEEEEPSSIGSDLPSAPLIPSAPEEERPAAPRSAPSKAGSVDVNLFPIPASSVPLMHSSSSGSNVATVNPFLVDQDVDYVTTNVVHESAASKPEGLTPDIVQEAYESEVYDIGVPKLSYEPKIDLVQTAAKVSQENVSPSVQNVALFQDADTVSSPVLPDIVMEAPLTSASVGLDAVAPQPDVSPVGRITPVNEEKLKFESEKPPSYEEAINKASSKAQEQVPVHVEAVKETRVEELETSYISIACDLVKETIPEQVATDFSKALKGEFDSQFASHFDESSPESEQSEPSYKLWEAEVISKEAANPMLGTEQNIASEKEQIRDTKWKEPSPVKSYLESYISEKVSDIVEEEPVAQISKPEKRLQMEEFETDDNFKDFEIPPTIAPIKEISAPSRDEHLGIKAPKWVEDKILKEQPKVKEDVFVKEKTKESYDNIVDLSKAGSDPFIIEKPVSKPLIPAKETSVGSKDKKEGSPATVPPASGKFQNSVVDLLYWRDIKKSGAVFGVSLFLLLSLTVFSIVSVAAYIALGLLSVSISFRIYKGVLQAIQKSDEGHPFKAYLDSNVAVSEDLVQKYCNIALSHINSSIKELRRLFLVEDLVDSLKFAVLMWVFTYIGALFNGLTLLILALISLFSIPVIYERHQTQIDHYLALINKNVKNVSELILSKIPGLKRKTD
ncbi:reticulon-4 isoform X3 [Ranitomeya imitator]|uniref:reticulon-4 isoform X3 n=1 Tax=Ranitomeya imitator TaxID=111125 RepID=UPI0037E7068D